MESKWSIIIALLGSLNYYQVLTGSLNASAGDVLHFNVTGENTTEFNHAVTAAM